ncbi:WD40-repeat-containing domain protein [Suillus variegatus]|nr:WD40-repeat-containing domain protein [Suillus variegatus]
MAVTTYQASTKASAQPVELTLKGHEERVNEVAFILGTRLLVTGSTDGSLRVWDLDTGKQVGEPSLGHDDRVQAVSASPDGHWIASGGWNGSILVWEVVANKRELKRVPVSFKGHENAVLRMVFAPDNKTFASASWDKTWAMMQTRCRTPRARPPDGTKLAAGTDEHIIIWNPASGEELLKIEQRAFRIAFTPDGLHLNPKGSHTSAYRCLYVWIRQNPLPTKVGVGDATTGDIIKQFYAHTDRNFSSLAIARNGTKFATASYDKTTRTFIATGCDDNIVRTWTVPLSESEKELQQKILNVRRFHARCFVQSLSSVLQKNIPDPRPRPKRAPIPTNRFFDDFDPTERNNRAGTTRNAKGSTIKNMVDRIFSHSSASQDQTPCPLGAPLVDVFATRGKYRTANPHSGKRDKLLKAQRPPRNWQAHAGASNSSTPPAETSIVVNETAPATLQIGSTRPSSPLDVAHAPHSSCFAVLARCLPCLSRSASGSR